MRRLSTGLCARFFRWSRARDGELNPEADWRRANRQTAAESFMVLIDWLLQYVCKGEAFDVVCMDYDNDVWKIPYY